MRPVGVEKLCNIKFSQEKNGPLKKTAYRFSVLVHYRLVLDRLYGTFVGLKFDANIPNCGVAYGFVDIAIATGR